tara:strand:+ start:1800 stop:2192 length:393 start_codon:yes stop_codon:yes gene_type:complete
MKTQLLCTFIKFEQIDEMIDLIKKQHTVVFNKVYVFSCNESDEDYICTYNVDSVNTRDILPNTISLHRKKQSNTLYTINSLNALIRTLNNGKLDKGYQINWNDYQNSLLLTGKEGFSQVKTKLHKIIQVD